jgi:hypothetical protein
VRAVDPLDGFGRHGFHVAAHGGDEQVTLAAEGGVDAVRLDVHRGAHVLDRIGGVSG